MTGLEYEHHVARYLTSRGYHGVKVTKGSGDFGVDVIAHKHGKKYAVQCKLYTGTVGVAAVQEAVAGKAMYRCDSAMVVTNSTFTKAAHELAAVNGVVLIERVEGKNTLAPAKGFGIFALLVYLFVASAIIYSTVEVIKGQPFLKAAYNVFSTVAVLSFPFWIGPVVKRLWDTIKSWVIALRDKIAAKKQPVPEDTTPTPSVNPIESKIEVKYPDGFQQYLNRSPAQNHPIAPQFYTQLDKCQVKEELRRIKTEQVEVYCDLYQVFKLGVEHGFISTSLVQRHMKWGYSRAMRVLDALEKLCFISPFQGNTPRQLLVSEQKVVDLIAEIENEKPLC